MTAPIPNLSERDARGITEKIVERLRAFGGLPQEFGVYLVESGFSFTCWLNGRMVTVQTGQGNFTYDAVARELIALSLDPHDWGSQIYQIEAPPAPSDVVALSH